MRLHFIAAVLSISLAAALCGGLATHGSTTALDFLPPDDPGPDAAFSFIVYGDVQGNHRKGHDTLARNMLRETASLVFNTGDMSPDGGRNYSRHFRSAAEALARRFSFFPSAGNHDVRWGSERSRAGFRTFFGPAFSHLSQLPGNGHLAEPDSQKLWYSITYGNVLFIVLDSNLFIDEGKYARTHAMAAYRDFPRLQTQWLRETLERHRDDERIRARFVFFHHSPIVSAETRPLPILGLGGHPDHRRMLIEYRLPGDGPYLLDLFRLHGVTAVFTGHEHYYERWQEVLRRDGRAVRTLNWVVNGMGGVKPRGRPLYEAEDVGELLRKEVFRSYLERASNLGKGWSAELHHVFPNAANPDGRFHNYMVVTIRDREVQFETRDVRGDVRDRGIFQASPPPVPDARLPLPWRQAPRHDPLHAAGDTP